MRHCTTFLAAGVMVLSTSATHAQPGWVLSHQKISDTEGGFTGTLDNGNRFGWSVASLGDLDGDGDADSTDFFAYLDLFASGDDGADIDGDGDIDAEDFFGFLDLFVQEC